MLYLIYFNDTKNVYNEPEINTGTFADDTCQITESRCIHKAMEEMNKIIMKLKDFVSANTIRINETKKEHIILKLKGRPLKVEVDLEYDIGRF